MHPMQKILAALVFGVVLASLPVAPAGAESLRGCDPPSPRVNVGPAGMDWLAECGNYERLVLTVAGPGGGLILRQETGEQARLLP